MGEVASTLSLVGGRIAQRRKIPMVSPSSTNPKVTQVGDYIFRVCFLDPFQGYVMAKFARDQLKLNKVAILKDVKNDYSIGLADALQEGVHASWAARSSAIESYCAGDTDFSAQLTKIKATRRPRASTCPATTPRWAPSRAGAPARPQGAADGRRRLGEPRAAQDRRRRHRGLLLLATTSRPTCPAPRARSSSRLTRPSTARRAPGLGALGYDAAAGLVDAMQRAPAAPSPRPCATRWPRPRSFDARHRQAHARRESQRGQDGGRGASDRRPARSFEADQFAPQT